MNRTQMIKQAYVRGLAARGLLRARMQQKRAAGGLKDYAISGGIGAAGGGALGSLIGALVQYARGKNVLRGALAGGGIGGGLGLLGGLGYQYSKKAPEKLSPLAEAVRIANTPKERNAVIRSVAKQIGNAQQKAFTTTGKLFSDLVSSVGNSAQQGLGGLQSMFSRKGPVSEGADYNAETGFGKSQDSYSEPLDYPYDPFDQADDVELGNDVENIRAQSIMEGIQNSIKNIGAQNAASGKDDMNTRMPGQGNLTAREFATLTQLLGIQQANPGALSANDLMTINFLQGRMAESNKARKKDEQDPSHKSNQSHINKTRNANGGGYR